MSFWWNVHCVFLINHQICMALKILIKFACLFLASSARWTNNAISHLSNYLGCLRSHSSPEKVTEVLTTSSNAVIGSGYQNISNQQQIFSRLPSPDELVIMKSFKWHRICFGDFHKHTGTFRIVRGGGGDFLARMWECWNQGSNN